jgi:hypothetical protein
LLYIRSRLTLLRFPATVPCGFHATTLKEEEEEQEQEQFSAALWEQDIGVAVGAVSKLVCDRCGCADFKNMQVLVPAFPP